MLLRSLLLLPVIAGCFSGNVQRAARVPHPGVPLSSGQPLTAPAELSAGLTSLGDFMTPKVGDSSQAVEVPATQMRDELRFRLGTRGQLALIYENGFAATTQRPDATQAPVGGGDVHGYGVSGSYAIETSTPGLVVGSTLEVIGWSLPYVEYKTCTDIECSGSDTVISHGRASPLTLGLGLNTSYRRGPITWFGGAFARNHPTAERKEINVMLDGDNGVRSGPYNLLFHAGVEIELARWLSALIVVHQDVTGDPVRYGPGVGFGLNARIGH